MFRSAINRLVSRVELTASWVRKVGEARSCNYTADTAYSWQNSDRQNFANFRQGRFWAFKNL